MQKLSGLVKEVITIQYIIMFMIIVGLSLSDILTGWIKAHIQNDYHSGTMRQGLYRKISEWLIMLTTIGLEAGLTELGRYYQSEQLADFAGTVTAISVFIYIAVMEVISILENFGDIHHDAAWIQPVTKRLRNQNHQKNQKER